MHILEVHVKDQYEQTYSAKAFLKEHSDQDLSLYQNIEYIEVNDEKILPTIELLFESQVSDKIYKVIDVIEDTQS